MDAYTSSGLSPAQRVAEPLKSPDDLLKIAGLRRKLRKEQESLEVSLRTGAKDQLDATRDALSKLMDTRVTVGEIREEMVNVERLCEDPLIHVDGFGKIGEVSKIHRHFTRTLEMVSQLRDMYDKIDYIEDMLAQERANPLGPAPNLLPIHYSLTQLESFRNETVLQAKRTSKETAQTLDRYFDRLSGTLESFESHYLHLASTILEIARAGHPTVAVKVAKIAEIEGARDEKAIAIRLVKRQGAELASKFKSLQADARVIKHYRAQVMDAIRTSARTALARFRDRYADPLEFLDNLDWIYKDLILVEDQLDARFPPDWKIYSVFIKAYHKALYDFLKEFVASGPGAGALLRLAQFCKEYTSAMTKELEIPSELLEPKLLDGKQQELIEDYVKLIVDKMGEWSENIMKMELAEFTTRDKPPEVDADDRYGMEGAVSMFNMINQQTDAAADSGQGMALARVVDECSRAMRDTQATWVKVIDSETKRQMTQTAEEVPGGLVEYVMALANDMIKSADFVEALLGKLEPLVSEKYRQPINATLNEAMDGYLNVAKKCIQTLIDLIFNDLKPATKLLFTNTWYNDDPMVQIIETIQDYMRDYQAHLNPSLFDLLVEDIIDTFLITYLTALRRASKLKNPSAADRIRDDVRKSFGFFATVKRNRDELESYFDVLDSLLKLITASKTMFFLDYWPFAKQYGPNLGYVSNLLKARDDINRTQANEILDNCKRKVEEEGMEEPEHSIFNRLPVETIAEKTGLSGFLGRS